jgi:hypothetical protein
MPYGRFTTAAVVLAIGFITLASAVVLAIGFITLASAVLLSRLWAAGPVWVAADAAVMVVTILLTVLVSTQRVDHFLSKATISGCYAAERYGELSNWYADKLGVGPDGSLLTRDIGGTLMTSRLPSSIWQA